MAQADNVKVSPSVKAPASRYDPLNVPAKPTTPLVGTGAEPFVAECNAVLSVKGNALSFK